MNTFGHYLRLTTFGESHGPAMGGVIDGFPSKIQIDLGAIDQELKRRRPDQGIGTSPRKESDQLTILSGLTPDGITLGTPIGFIIPNIDARPTDYEEISGLFRPNHADFTYQKKYGIRAASGGGRASARETVSRVVGGAFARQLLALREIKIEAWISAVGAWKAPDIYAKGHFDHEIQREVMAAVAQGDSIGGRVSCLIRGCPIGLGEPVFHKFQARLSEAMMTLPGAKAFEYGLGCKASEARGSLTADIFCTDSQHEMTTLSNFSGGIQGGISNGKDITFAVSFKPTPTIMQSLPTVDQNGKKATLPPRGRHDACIALRAVPVVEAMACLTTADLLLASRL